MRAIPTDIYDKEGNLTRIEVSTEAGDHIADFQWDPSDEQTSENRITFRKWVYTFLEQRKGYEVDK